VIHTVTGALVLATTVMVTLACYRLARPSGVPARAFAPVAGSSGQSQHQGAL
jgi:hypothetical protein